MDALRRQYRYEKETPTYNIRRAKRVAAPHILSSTIDKYDGTNYELLTDLIKDTEQFRIDRMMSIMLHKGSEPKDRKAAINYLLKSFEKLNKQQCVSVINAIHRLIGRPGTPADIKVKLAEELKAFLGTGQSKNEAVSSYEKMLHEEGEAVIEDG